MTRRTLGLVMLAALAVAAGRADEAVQAPPSFDAGLAAELGADDYGMRPYVMALLKTGPNTGGDAEEVRQLQAGHMANMRRLHAAGHLIVAGPFLDGGSLRGIFVLAVDSVEDAAALVATDPAVQAGRFSVELHRWYGPAGLMRLDDIQSVITRQTP